MVIAGVLGRLPDAIIPYALLLVLAPQRGFAVAGTASGAYSLAYAFASPLRGRLVDRLGARPVLFGCGALQPVVLVALAVAVAGRSGDGPIISLAAATAALTPPVSAVVRRVWETTLADDQVRDTAYAFESVVGQVNFILGTVIAGSLATLGVTSLLIAALCRAVALLALALQDVVSSLPTANEHLHWLGPLRSGAFRMLLVVVAVDFASHAAVDVGVAAFARAAGAASLTGVLLGSFGVGSTVGGLVQGARDWRAPLARQQTGWLVALTISLALLTLAPNVLALAVLLVVAGVTVAPATTVQLTLASNFAPRAATTEALTWVASFYYVGFAAGNTVAGGAAQNAGPRAALFAAAVFALAATLLSLVGRDRLRQVLAGIMPMRKRRPRAHEPCDISHRSNSASPIFGRNLLIAFLVPFDTCARGALPSLLSSVNPRH